MFFLALPILNRVNALLFFVFGEQRFGVSSGIAFFQTNNLLVLVL